MVLYPLGWLLNSGVIPCSTPTNLGPAADGIVVLVVLFVTSLVLILTDHLWPRLLLHGKRIRRATTKPEARRAAVIPLARPAARFR